MNILVDGHLKDIILAHQFTQNMHTPLWESCLLVVYSRLLCCKYTVIFKWFSGVLRDGCCTGKRLFLHYVCSTINYTIVLLKYHIKGKTNLQGLFHMLYFIFYYQITIERKYIQGDGRFLRMFLSTEFHNGNVENKHRIYHLLKSYWIPEI